MNYPTIFRNIREIPPAPRRFLLFTGINVFSWQCIVGQALVLFGRSLDMPPSWIGTLLSFMPLSMLFVIFSIPAVQVLGPRKLMTITWLTRNFFAVFVFTIPFALKIWGREAAWYILLFSTGGFSLARAFGVGSWYPWLHEIVPQPILGTYFAIETIIVQSISVVLTLGIGKILGLTEQLYRFYWVYAIGISAGLISILYMRRIPGGMSTSEKSATVKESFSVIFRALKDTQYIRFIFFIIFSMASFMWISIASILYLRDILGYTDTIIMYFFAVAAVLIAITVRFWVRQAEKFGSEKIMAILMATQILVAVLWICVSPGKPWTFALALTTVALGGSINAGFSIISCRGMMTLVPHENRVGYTSLWIMAISVANGVPPIIAGWLIDIFHLAGFLSCFLLSAGFALCLSVLWWHFRFEVRTQPMANLHHIIRPTQPLRALGRIIWLIFGRGSGKE
ncbi:MAG: hypothetical protein KJ737_00745 [Proteobacteria bacterium]|nr:hypothetical protein [Pseudomonadota bacterium]